jgi:hypothetical protein
VSGQQRFWVGPLSKGSKASSAAPVRYPINRYLHIVSVRNPGGFIARGFFSIDSAPKTAGRRRVLGNAFNNHKLFFSAAHIQTLAARPVQKVGELLTRWDKSR